MTDQTAAQFNAEVADALARLDGTTRSAVALLTGIPSADLDDLGGFGDDTGPAARTEADR
ncbi:hypothetical protein GCM10011608_10820 [Micromonospora sonchi]|uniref:Uncharacterized protein n=1 Tax=Micromonospora sonchi TaxID=1763543 RepID=A0A917TMJ1_9ACTN|nr:hypothetical protein [Micromonospora sonchi]GGM27847.1 hypothetical protein GCM10011608_10820 [Micromonospora sonchi]